MPVIKEQDHPEKSQATAKQDAATDQGRPDESRDRTYRDRDRGFGRQGLPGKRDIFSRMSSRGVPSKDASDYCNLIRESIEDKSSSINLEMKNVGNVVVIYDDHNMIGLVFEDESRPMTEREYAESNIIPEAKITLRDAKWLQPRKLDQIVCVHSYMLNRAEQMANFIKDRLFILSIQDEVNREINLANFAWENNNGYQIRIDTRPEAVRNYFQRVSPVGTNPIECGFIVERSIQADKSGYSQPDEVMFAVGAYTEFIPDKMDHNFPSSRLEYKFTPVVHVSEVYTPVPGAGLTAMVIAMVVDQFANRGIWMTPYLQGNEFGDITNLLVDETGKPEVSQSVEDKDYVLHQIVDPKNVVIAFDAVAGQPQYMNIAKMVTAEGASEFTRELKTFLNADDLASAYKAAKESEHKVTYTKKLEQQLEIVATLINNSYVGDRPKRTVIGIWPGGGGATGALDTRNFTYLKALDLGFTTRDARPLAQIDDGATFAKISVLNRLREFAARPTNLMQTSFLRAGLAEGLAKYVGEQLSITNTGGSNEQYSDSGDIQQFAIRSGSAFGQRGGDRGSYRIDFEV